MTACQGAASACRITQANAAQRAGRAGRVQPGRCYRVYPRALHDAMDPFVPPEMQRTPLEGVCMTIRSLGAAPRGARHGAA